MNKNLMKLSAAAVATMLLAATPALADEHGGTRVDSGTDVHVSAGLHLGPIVSALAHARVDQDVEHNGQEGDSDQDSDIDEQHEHHAASTAPSLIDQTVAIGTVSGTSGASFTLNPLKIFAGASGTTTVQTNASTHFRGGATSTASLSNGADVLVVGTSSTTSPGTITATLVILLQSVAQFFHDLFSH